MESTKPESKMPCIISVMRAIAEQEFGSTKYRMISLVIITLLLGASVIFLLFTLWKSGRVRQWTAGLGRRRFLNSLSRKKHEKMLNGDTSNAQSVQESLLLNILETHQNTEYGQRHNFKDITDVSSFQKRHPLTHYSDYKDYIQRTREGEENILLQGRPHALIVTTGTSANPSVIPVSAKSSRDRFLKGIAVYLEVIQSHFPSALEKVAKFTFPPDDNRSEAGIPIIPYPSVCFFSLLEKIYLSPVLFHNSMSQNEILYTQLLFALKDVELRILEANYSWFLRHVFSILEEHWESLITDIQQGRLNPVFKLPLHIRKQIEDGLIPDAVRAEELRAQFKEGFCGIAKRVWPKLQVVIALESGSSDLDRQILKDTVCQGVPFYSPMYCTAEGLCGVNLSPVESIPQYVLCPSSAFFEFITVDTSDQDQPHTLCIQDVSKGKPYELVITNRDGLYRYRLGDIVQVTGFHNRSPILELLYRKSQTLSVRGERISESSFYKSLLQTVGLWPGASLLNYCCAESGIMGPFSGGSDPHYQVFVALKGVRDLSEEQRYKLDQTLQEHFPIYKSFRLKGSIGPVRVHLTSPKAFLNLKELVANLSGVPLDCVPFSRTLKYQELAECIWKQVLS
ncbi:PREDICTED: GH3 domain-containing protein [Nanorana parkeri]|uniref:GH3 domain-containing protein n=1 Tax=Nanorana parkeri TaxID=125878 RepID=UPI00085459F3|nr:PREDICTED: GH3 domain-containing protein [Nanorana parkeri]